jgi:adenylate kinase
MVAKKTAIIMIGAPGSGKGTQGEILANKLKFKRYVMSDLIKDELKKKKKTWAKSYDVTSGLLLGDSEIFEVFREHFGEEKEILLDGIPRTLDQAYWLYGFLKQHNYTIECIYLKVDEKKLLTRILKRGRKDDTKAIFGNRLKLFDTVRDVMLKVYTKDMLVINGDRDIESIAKDMLVKVKTRISKSK